MLCPFLTTDKEQIECFKECAFLEYEGNENTCPFRVIVKKKKYKVFYDNSYIGDELEEKKCYLKDIYMENY